jgi:hypothetical protein
MIEFERKISVGHIVQMVVFVGTITVALGSGYITNGYRVQSLELETSNQKQAIVAMQNHLDNLETNTNGALARVQNLLTDLRVDAAKQSNLMTDMRVDAAKVRPK